MQIDSNTLDLMLLGDSVECVKYVLGMSKKETRNKWKSHKFGKEEIFMAKEAESWRVLDLLLNDKELECIHSMNKEDWEGVKKSLDDVDISQLGEDDEKAVKRLRNLIRRRL